MIYADNIFFKSTCVIGLWARVVYRVISCPCALHTLSFHILPQSSVCVDMNVTSDLMSCNVCNVSYKNGMIQFFLSNLEFIGTYLHNYDAFLFLSFQALQLARIAPLDWIFGACMSMWREETLPTTLWVKTEESTTSI